MNNIHTLVLAPENAKELMETQAQATGAELVVITPSNAQDFEQDKPLAQTLSLWDDLRQTGGSASRYNSHLRFLSNISKNTDTNNFQTAILFCKQDKAIALIRGNVSKQTPWLGMGKLNKLLPGLLSITIPKTAILTDGSDEATQLVGDYLSSLVDLRLVSLLKLDNMEVGQDLSESLSQYPGLSRAVVKTKQIRWIRQLLDPKTKEPINQNSAKTRSSWRRKHRNLEKEFDGDLVLNLTDQTEQADEFVESASSIVDKTYQNALGIGIRNTPAIRSFVSEMCSEGRFRGYLASGKGKAISYVAGDVEGGRFNLWATSFLPEYMRLSPGLVLLNHVISELTNEGVEVLDFGHGEAAYKERFGNEKLNEIDLRIYSPGLVSTIAHKSDTTSIWLKTTIRNLTKKLQLIDLGRRWWRRFLQNQGTAPQK